MARPENCPTGAVPEWFPRGLEVRRPGGVHESGGPGTHFIGYEELEPESVPVKDDLVAAPTPRKRGRPKRQTT